MAVLFFMATKALSFKLRGKGRQKVFCSRGTRSAIHGFFQAEVSIKILL